MKALDTDIFLFENILDEKLCNSLLELRNLPSNKSRINLFDVEKKLFYSFNEFWMNNIENVYLNEYLKYYDVEKNIGLNASKEVIDDLKNYNKTKWRDMFLLYYDKETNNQGEHNIHWDFSGITMVSCLNDEYLGGELVFPRQKISYKLKKKDIVLFPGGLTHPHYANAVTEGIRNVLVGQSTTLVQDHKLDYE